MPPKNPKKSDSVSAKQVDGDYEIHSRLLSTDDRELASRQGYKQVVEYDDFRKYFRSDSGSEPEKIKDSERIVVDGKGFFEWMSEIGALVDHKENDERQRYYFRGERTAEYNLLPSMLRNNKFNRLKKQHGASTPLELQKKLLDRYKRYTQHLIHADRDFDAPIYDDFDTLCLAQHHMLPTLLLDWTLNPYVAAYFALSGVSSTLLREKLTSEPRITKYWVRVWVMRLKPPNARKEHTIHLEDRSQKWDEQLGNARVIPSAPKIVVPLVFTRRIAAQVGRFVYCGYMARDYQQNGENVKSLPRYFQIVEESDEKGQAPWDRLYSVDIEFNIGLNSARDWVAERRAYENESDPKKYREKHDAYVNAKKDEFLKEIEKMMRKLEFMGFHAGRLYPDLEGWAKYLDEGNL